MGEQFDVRSCLQRLQRDYRYEISDHLVTGKQGDKAYKVRNNWWTALHFVLELGLEQRAFSPDFTPVIERLRRHILTEEFSTRPKTPDDVRFGNQLIEDALKAMPTRV